jgi:hypothetical protein
MESGGQYCQSKLPRQVQRPDEAREAHKRVPGEEAKCMGNCCLKLADLLAEELSKLGRVGYRSIASRSGNATPVYTHHKASRATLYCIDPSHFSL